MRHAVILSSFIPETEVAQAVGTYFLDLIRRYFSDAQIYVGVNTGSSDTWHMMLEQSGLDMTICKVPPHMSVNSDVAGFQAVLRTLRATRANHDFYWFGHTKGATHERFEDAEALRSVIEQAFWSRRAEVEAHCDPTRHGTFSALPMPSSGRNAEEVAYLRSIFPALYPPVGAIPTYTFFGMTGVALRNFLASADERFFSQNIVDGTGVSRYFFEGGFSWIADMAGFEPYLLHKETAFAADDSSMRAPCHPDDFLANRQKVAGLIETWKADRARYDFPGWPVWVGEQIEFQGRVHASDDFFRVHPEYAPHRDI